MPQCKPCNPCQNGKILPSPVNCQLGETVTITIGNTLFTGQEILQMPLYGGIPCEGCIKKVNGKFYLYNELL